MTDHIPHENSSMDELIVRVLQGRATSEEERRVREWRIRSPANERRYRDLRRIWDLTEAGAVHASDEPRDLPDVNALIERAESGDDVEDLEEERAGIPLAEHRSDESEEEGGERPPAPWLRRAALGALAAGLVAVGFGTASLMEDETPPQALLSQGEIVTGSGELTTIKLGDGSSIRLGPDSRLRLAEEGKHRSAWLDGRAFFGVKTDSARPFTVRTSNGEARVLGTRFEVRAERDEFRVLVVEGEVSVSAGGKDLSVKDGELTRSSGGGVPSKERVEDVYAHLDWLGNALVFQSTPFEQAVTEIERRYGVEVELRNPALGDLSVTATFTDRPLDEVVLVLCEIVRAECTIEENRVRIGTTRPAAFRNVEDG